MIRFDSQVTIDRPADEVFGYVADLRHLPEWSRAIDRTDAATPGPPGEGSVYRQRRSFPLPQDEELRIERFDEPHRLTVVGTLGPFEARLEYEFVPEGESTRIHSRVALEADGVLRLAQPFAGARVQREVRGDLQALKEVLETGRSQERRSDRAP